MVQVIRSTVHEIQRGTFKGVKQCKNFLYYLIDEGNYDGISLMPVNGVLGSIILDRYMLGDLPGKTLAVEASFRSERGIVDILRDHPIKMWPIAAMAMWNYPHVEKSLEMLIHIQEAVGDIPAIVHPRHEGVDVAKFPGVTSRLVAQGEPPYTRFNGVKNRVFYIAPEMLDRYGVNFPGLWEALQERGAEGLCLDTKHVRRPVGQGFTQNLPDWEVVIDDLWPHIKVVKLNVASNRLWNIQWREEFEMLMNLHALNWDGLVVVQINGEFSCHKQLVDRIRGIFE